MSANRPLKVYKERGVWWWDCNRCNWTAPEPSRWLQIAYTRAEMHFEIAHCGVFQRSAS